jgi:hypothetical protein
MKVFGSQIHFALAVFAARHSPATLGKKMEEKVMLAQQYSRVVMQMVVSVLCIGGMLLIIFKNPSDGAAVKPAYGLLGFVAGYWLH